MRRLLGLAAVVWIGRWAAGEVAMAIGKRQPPSNG